MGYDEETVSDGTAQRRTCTTTTDRLNRGAIKIKQKKQQTQNPRKPVPVVRSSLSDLKSSLLNSIEIVTQHRRISGHYWRIPCPGRVTNGAPDRWRAAAAPWGPSAAARRPARQRCEATGRTIG
ncbi:hypothetical protein GWI33_009101 [Rhynchophorus ferrugineus]|uniref:Uncharacterized protein n=1 Tax=Rhynchophorus ferrugineus TaxID=354439 RepID=A0A834MGR8_RHYFE|nr:hypothetical protein GWI33_009101 [Rhynchophorus ferrugineus]